MTYVPHVQNTDCVEFNGYKPCRLKRPCANCPHYTKRGEQILLINLGALGDVARTTALLPAIKRCYPNSQITWLTSPLASQILQNIPFIHEVIPYNWETFEVLKMRTFDLALNVDKEKSTGALMRQVSCADKRGFGIGPFGEVIALNHEARENYDLGLNDRDKFFVCEKSELRVLCDTMGFPYARDEYQLTLSSTEMQESLLVREMMLTQMTVSKIVGFNTGCSNLFAYKKMNVEDSTQLIINILREDPTVGVALLGGKEDTERQNAMIARLGGDKRVFNTPTEGGIRAGMVWLNAVDAVASGDSFGLHLAIGLKKPTVAWFGLSVATEIEFFDRGEAIRSDVPCGPCWLKSCEKPIKCFEQVDVHKLANRVIHWMNLAR